MGSVAVPVAHEDIDQPRGQESARIRAVGGALPNPREQLLALDDPLAGDRRNHAEHVAELLPVLAQGRRIRHEVGLGGGVQHVGPRLQRTRDDRRGRMERAVQVLHDGSDRGPSDHPRHALAERFHDRPKRVPPSVGGAEEECAALTRAAPADERQAAGEGVEIQNLDTNPGVPFLPVVGPPEEAEESTPLELRTGNDRDEAVGRHGFRHRLGALVAGDLGNADRRREERRSSEKCGCRHRPGALPKRSRATAADSIDQSEPSVAGW